MSDENHGLLRSPAGPNHVDRKLDMMRAALGRVESGAASLAAWLPNVEDKLVRSELGQAAQTARVAATSLREGSETLADAAGRTDAAIAVAPTLDTFCDQGLAGDGGDRPVPVR